MQGRVWLVLLADVACVPRSGTDRTIPAGGLPVSTPVAEPASDVVILLLEIKELLTVGPPVLLRPRHAAAYLGIKVSTLNQLVAERKGPPKRKIGKATVYRRDDLAAWAAKQKLSH